MPYNVLEKNITIFVAIGYLKKNKKNTPQLFPLVVILMVVRI